jgi:flagellar hook protein FlgE
MPFNIALSGLNAASTDLEVTGNNIANAATNGFKESRAEFADVYAHSIVNNSATATGDGVRVSRIAQQFAQGAVDFTSSSLDLAINGDGFFVLEDNDGTQSYTRAGAYSADRNGFVVNHANHRLQVYPAVIGSNGVTTFNTGVLSDLQLPTTASSPQPTQNLTAGLNLNANLPIVPTATTFDPTDSGTYNSSTSTSVYDSLGNAHTATFYFRRQDPASLNTWDSYLYIDNAPVTIGGAASGQLTFDANGALTAPAGGTLTTDPFNLANGAAPISMVMDFAQTTQFGASFAVNNLSQDGFASGRLSGVNIDAEGIVFARYTNGQSASVGKVALAKFNNSQGLNQVSDTNWAETFASGLAQLGEAGTSSFGQIQSGALEASNVDIAEQLVKLITAQRNFQANAEVISTADAITQTVINIR